VPLLVGAIWAEVVIVHTSPLLTRRGVCRPRPLTPVVTACARVCRGWGWLTSRSYGQLRAAQQRPRSKSVRGCFDQAEFREVASGADFTIRAGAW
jgi:hypothetical protein